MPRYYKNRKEALSNAKEFYLTGIPCVRGHLVKRRTVNWSCTECAKIRGRQYVKRNKKSLHKKWKKRYYKNPEHYRALTRKWSKNNKKKKLISQRKWREKNWMSVISQNAKRRINGAKRKYGFCNADINKKLEKQRGKCPYCKISLIDIEFHLDHRKPIAQGGTNHKNNIQVLCKKCNLEKGAKNHREYLKYLKVKIVYA